MTAAMVPVFQPSHSALNMSDAEAALFFPFEGAKVDAITGNVYVVSIKLQWPNNSVWLRGTTVRNAAAAWTCVNYIRRTKPYLSVKVERNPSEPVHSPGL